MNVFDQPYHFFKLPGDWSYGSRTEAEATSQGNRVHMFAALDGDKI
jgi:hypothetical protein